MGSAMTNPPRTTSSLVRRGGALAVWLLAAACVYDPDNRCGEHQQLDARGVCVCMAGNAQDPITHVCFPCGANEEVRAGACACLQGYSREAPGKPCAAAPTGLGAGCSPTNMCKIAPYQHCQAPRAGESYCTSTGCTRSSDCTGSYSCDRSGTMPFCRRPPTGEGKACTSADECKGLEASHCETFFVHTCLVEGCNPQDPASCSDGWKCCDVTPLGLPKTLCLRMDKCP